MSRRRLVLALILPVSMVAPAQAVAATYTGKSTQGLSVALKTRSNGRPRQFVFAWYARCRSGVVRSVTRATPGSRTTYRKFASHGSYLVRQAGGVRLSITGIAGGTRASAREWRGSFRLTAVVRKSGRVVDRCHLGNIRWQAARP